MVPWNPLLADVRRIKYYGPGKANGKRANCAHVSAALGYGKDSARNSSPVRMAAEFE
jgi:hypothetical protein